MAFDERSAWVMIVTAVLGYGVYVGWLLALGAGSGVPLVELEYAVPMLVSIGGAIAASIVIEIVLDIRTGKGRRRDQRDREIGRWGELGGQSLLIVGGLGALVLALVEAHWFWIANALYLGFMLSAVLGSALKIVAYRRGLPW